MNNTSKTIIIVVLVLIAAALGYFVFKKNPPVMLQKQNTAQSQPQNLGDHTQTNAPAGKVVAGFPSDLNLDSTAKITKSYQLDYPGMHTYTVEFQSANKLADEYNLYLNYANANGYNITNKTLNSNIAVLYAQKDKNQISFTANNASNGFSAVTVTYLTQE